MRFEKVLRGGICREGIVININRGEEDGREQTALLGDRTVVLTRPESKVVVGVGGQSLR